MFCTPAPLDRARRLVTSPDEIDLWWLDLDTVGDVIVDTISSAERERALAMRHPRDASRRLAGSAILRNVLARYGDLPAAELALTRDARGYPELTGSGLRFSVSHAGPLGAIAVGSGRALGIDVEPISAAQQIAEVADAYLPRDRNLSIRAAHADEQDRRWVELWTEVEARAKMSGDGIGSLSPIEAARLLSMQANVTQLAPRPGFLATLVYDGSPARLRIRSVDGESAT